MIITRISGGLGNQMFQYAIAKCLAKKNNDLYKLDLSFYPKQNLRKYELNLFQIEENIATEKESVALRGKEGLYFKIRKKIRKPLIRPISYIKEKEKGSFDINICSIKYNCYLDGFWQNEKYFTSIRDEVLTDFTPKKEIDKDAQKYLEGIKSVNSISVHVRRGDYVFNSQANGVHGVCDIEYYKRAVNYTSKTIEKPIYYIFSDDIGWCKENFDFVENKVFVDDTKSAIDDLQLMRNCRHNIIANSTFSWWAAWLNTNDDKLVVVPSVWWVANSDKHIAPDDWIKI